MIHDFEPKYIKVLGSMTCKVQSMTLYVWEKSGYFTQQQQKDRRLVQINNNQKVTWQQNGKIPSFFLPPSKGVEVFVGAQGLKKR